LAVKNSTISKEKKAEYKKKIQEFCLMDDTFMSKVFEDKKCTEELLRIILEKDDLKVKSVKTQYVIDNLQGHSIRLDIRAADGKGKIYDIEIQNDNSGAVPKRARYNSSIIDANELEKGEDYDKLPETYVIFITKNDILGGNKLIYHIDRTIKEMRNCYFGDEAHIIYIYSQKKSRTEIGKLMHDFYCKNADEMYNKTLAKRVKHFKEDIKGVNEMCAIMEELTTKATKEAVVATKLEDIKNIMNNFNVTVEKAMSTLKISKDDYAMYIEMLNKK